MSTSSHPLTDRAREVAPALAARSQDIEQARRVPQEVADELAALGMFRMLVPKSLRGLEVPPRVLVEVLRELARGDAACAWHVMTGATNGLLSAYLPLETARSIWGENPRVVTAGVFAPSGRAEPTADGYRLSGRWGFASGCENASWLMGGALVAEGDERVIRSFLFPATEAKVIDSWDVAGLCGTGSHHIEVEDVMVPRSHTCSLVVDPPQHDGALYRFPVFGLLAAGVAAVALGIGSAAIDALTALAKSKRSFGGKRTLAEGEDMQRVVASATAELGAGAAYLRTACDESFAAAQDGELGPDARAELRLAATHATRCAVRATDAMYEAGGGTALYRTSSLQRHFRDVHAVTQHIMVSRQTLKTVGRVLLGDRSNLHML